MSKTVTFCDPPRTNHEFAGFFGANFHAGGPSGSTSAGRRDHLRGNNTGGNFRPRTYSRPDYVPPRVPNPRMTTLGILRANFRKNKGLLVAKKIRNKDLLVTKCMT